MGINIMDEEKLDSIEKAIVFLLKLEPTLAQFALGMDRKDTDKVALAAIGVSKNKLDVVLMLNMAKLSELGFKEVFYVMVHEFMHLLMNHFVRKTNRDAKFWNVAADLAINTLLDSMYHSQIGKLKIKIGIRPGEGQFKKYRRGQTAEEYYEQLKQDKEITITESKPGSGDGMYKVDGPGGETEYGQDNHGEMTEEQVEVAIERMKDAISKSCGKGSSGMQSIIDEFMKGQLDWRAALRMYVGSIKALLERSLVRPNRKIPGRPGNKRTTCLDIFFGVDTSGSMGDDEIKVCLSEVLGFMRLGGKITICEFDDRVQKVYEVQRGRKPNLKVQGRGGTDFKPVFELIEKNRRKKPDVVIIASDMAVGPSEFPKKSPIKNVIWLACHDGHPAPFGRTLKIKV